MSGAGKRIVGALLGLDEGANALLGGFPRESLSGSIGRACGYGPFGKERWWGPAAKALVDGMPWFGKGHCELAAMTEAERRAKLEAVT